MEARRMTDNTTTTLPKPSGAVPIELYWSDQLNNFGDKLSPLIVEYVSGRPVRHTGRSPKLHAIGSTVNIAKDGDVLWGSGLWFPGSVSPKLHFVAVRGPLTRNCLLQQDIDCPAVFGDPAILLPLYYSPSVPKKTKLSIMPHYKDAILENEARQENLPLISVHDDPFHVIDSIIASEMIVTSSLHGLIVAESYGVPVALLLNDSFLKIRSEFKYQDYFQSTGRKNLALYGLSLSEASKKPLPEPEFPDRQRLINAFSSPLP